MKTLYVEVTDEDIHNAERKDGWRCPIAQAINRLYPEVGATYVDEEEVIIGRGVLVRHFTPTARARRFIRRWDNGYCEGPTYFFLRPAD